jgi:hypothetical protein
MPTRMIRFAGAVCVAALLSGAALAQTPSPAKSQATLTVVYEFTGAGDVIPQSKESHVKWNITNRYEVKATMEASAAGGFGALHKPDAAEQAREAGRMTAANQAAGDMSSMMAQAEAIMEKCGEDEACITRESMKMAQGVDMNSAQMKSAKSNIAKASEMPGARYQLFSPGKQSGTFTIEEYAYEAYFDAACSLKNEATCAAESTVKGKGPITLNQAGAMAEIDYQAGTLKVILAHPGPVKATKTVLSKSADTKSGTSQVNRQVPTQIIKQEGETVKCGACKTASGSFTKEIEDELLGRKGQLKVSWTFSRP